MTPEDHCTPVKPSGWRHKITLAVFLAIGLFFLLTEHRAHLFGLLPYFLVLACPLAHLFMHGGHGRHRIQEGRGEGEP